MIQRQQCQATGAWHPYDDRQQRFFPPAAGDSTGRAILTGDLISKTNRARPAGVWGGSQAGQGPHRPSGEPRFGRNPGGGAGSPVVQLTLVNAVPPSPFAEPRPGESPPVAFKLSGTWAVRCVRIRTRRPPRLLGGPSSYICSTLIQPARKLRSSIVFTALTQPGHATARFLALRRGPRMQDRFRPLRRRRRSGPRPFDHQHPKASSIA